MNVFVSKIIKLKKKYLYFYNNLLGACKSNCSDLKQVERHKRTQSLGKFSESCFSLHAHSHTVQGPSLSGSFLGTAYSEEPHPPYETLALHFLVTYQISQQNQLQEKQQKVMFDIA